MTTGNDKQKWNDRYRTTTYAYGKTPNLFFKEWLQKFPPGTILMPADGEARNGVFAAQMGWNVTSFDLSEEACSKALQLAREQQVTINYLVGELEQLSFPPASFDAIGLIYAHIAAEKKSAFHRQLNTLLKPGGIILFEAFSKKHLPLKQLNPKVGGPDDIAALFSEAEIMADFVNYDTLLLTEEEIHLEEGRFHSGKGAVIRFVGRKSA